MSDRFDVLVLSPHFDDAVLSCGGRLKRLAAHGSSVCVVTVCGGPPPDVPPSPYARSLHERWSRADPSSVAAENLASAAREMVERRSSEDAAAIRRLGCTRMVLDVPDAIYRRSPTTGDWLYVGDDAIFGELSRDETPLVDEVAHRLRALRGSHPTIKALAPLAVGSHVDHQLVRHAAESAWGARQIGYYEDYPYSGDQRLLAQALGTIKFVASNTPLAPDDLAAKIEAVSCYQSQISTFWTDERQMSRAVTDFAMSRGVRGRPSERTWRLAQLHDE